MKLVYKITIPVFLGLILVIFLVAMLSKYFLEKALVQEAFLTKYEVVLKYAPKFLRAEYFSQPFIPSAQEGFKSLSEEVKTPSMVRFTVWSKDGVILFSDLKSVIGFSSPNHRELKRVFSEEKPFFVVRKRDTNQPVQSEVGEFLDIYIPIRLSREIVGAVQIHSVLAAVLFSVEKQALYTTYILVVSAILILAVVYFLANHLRGEVDRNRELYEHTKEQAVELERAHEATKVNLERIEALREIDRAITSSLDLRTVLDILLEKIDVVLPYSATTIRLFNKESGLLEPVACRNLDEKEWKTEEWKGGRGVPNVAFESKTPVMISNVQSDPSIRDPEFFRKHNLVSYLGVPLIAQSEVLGVISFYAKEEHEFSKEVEFLTTLAGQAAIAIYNSQLYKEIKASSAKLESTNQRLERSLEELSQLYTALSPLAPKESVDEMLDGIIERLMVATGADAALIRLQDKETGAFYWASQRGFPDYYLKAAASPQPGSVLEQIFESGEPIIASDIASDSRLKGKFQLQVGLRSCAMLPLKARNEVRGIIHLASRELGYFDESQKDHLMAIARQMGIALENRQLFDELKASNVELERSNRVKDEFLSVMSHELRTPLNVVMGYAAMMKDGMLGDVNSKQDDALGKILGRVNDQLAMINNILFSTAIEASKIPVERHVVILADLFNDLESAYFAQATGPDLTLNWDCPPDLPILETDQAKLKQILQNLIDNAIKFTAKGKISISARHNREAKTIELQVADTGLGIPRDMIAAIFEKFRQVDSSETRPYGGVGMGLYIVKSFTEMLAGKIEVESEFGKGSTFTIHLPLRTH